MPSLAEIATPDGYLRALRVMHGFHTAWEPAIWSTPGLLHLGLSESVRRKLPLLTRDLKARHAEPLTAGPPPAPELDLPSALGALYVLEGATLGGRVILRQVRLKLHLDERNGAAYFSGYGDRTGEMWQDFGAIVDRYAHESGKGAQVVRGGVSCFAAFESWITECSSAATPPSAPVTGAF